jgi:hypothetical protein
MSRSYRAPFAAILNLDSSSQTCREFPQKCSQRAAVGQQFHVPREANNSKQLPINDLQRRADWHWSCTQSRVGPDLEAVNGRLCHDRSRRSSRFPLRVWCNRHGNEARTRRGKERLARLPSLQDLHLPPFVVGRNLRSEKSNSNPAKISSPRQSAAPQAFRSSLPARSSLTLRSML